MRRIVIAGLLLAASPLHSAPAGIPAYVTRAVDNPRRSGAAVGSDPIRLPAETLAFAGVKPGMNVGEFYPGSGYFTGLLSDIVGPRGHVHAIENKRWNTPEQTKGFAGRWKNVSFEAAPFGTVHFAKPLDVAWITQNYHDLKIAKYGVVDTLAFDRAVFAALKPGGTFFILDHEAPAGTDVAGIEKLHRIEKAQVIREVEAAGFKLQAEGTFLNRPGDDHTLSIFDKRIQGRTDQYALRFVKPR